MRRAGKVRRDTPLDTRDCRSPTCANRSSCTRSSVPHLASDRSALRSRRHVSPSLGRSSRSDSCLACSACRVRRDTRRGTCDDRNSTSCRTPRRTCVPCQCRCSACDNRSCRSSSASRDCRHCTADTGPGDTTSCTGVDTRCLRASWHTIHRSCAASCTGHIRGLWLCCSNSGIRFLCRNLHGTQGNAILHLLRIIRIVYYRNYSVSEYKSRIQNY